MKGTVVRELYTCTLLQHLIMHEVASVGVASLTCSAGCVCVMADKLCGVSLLAVSLSPAPPQASAPRGCRRACLSRRQPASPSCLLEAPSPSRLVWTSMTLCSQQSSTSGERRSTWSASSPSPLRDNPSSPLPSLPPSLSPPCLSVNPAKKYAVQIEPLVGELLKAIQISESDFCTLQG